MARSKHNSFWFYLLFVLIGYVLGLFLAETLGSLQGFKWLAFGADFKLGPLDLDLGFIAFTIGLRFRITIGSIIGLIISLLIHRFI